ncbi:Mitochondrial K+-H+ exchange-related [Teratosphaeria destructans]|uniref:Mitochondrial K+-H+ exchange-related n=1 Tax=Teratosphaeria destructans TaxID=418781 RepID=A0A9W7SJB2_9PEZI|nr:Mitochondrial K+-H+ exchange-related [Teratosphaeria destructans]
MRLFLLPISTRRTLIYCERIQESIAGKKPPITDRVTNFAADTWAKWEKAEKGWQKQLTEYGNRMLKRIPYEEWGLKSFPPATKKRLKEVDEGKHKFACLYPGAFVKSSKVGEILRTLATERQALHSRRMWTCIAWMPVTIPFQIIPVIPNIPFYYAVYRAWSHYRALYGGKLLQHIVDKNLVHATDSRIMDQMYAAGLINSSRQKSQAAATPAEADIEKAAGEVEQRAEGGRKEVMLLQRWDGKLIAEAFKHPELEVEIERAVEQVEDAIRTAEEEGKPDVQQSKEVFEKSRTAERIEQVRR